LSDASDFGLIRVATRIVDGVNVVDEFARAVIGAAGDLHDDGVVAEFEQALFFKACRAGAQRLHAAGGGNAGLRELSIE